MTGEQPGDEVGRRRAALDHYAVLDTPAEEAFDDLALLAAEGCATAVAAIGLLADGRQWFKARVGIADREVSLADSICALIGDEADLTVIPDLSADPRIAASDVVGRWGMRFYASVPLRDAAGGRLGTLIVMDPVARDGLTSRQAETLRRLGRQASAQLELRRLRVAGQRAAGAPAPSRPDAERAAALSERHWRDLFEKLSEGFLVGELIRAGDGQVVDWRYLDVNRAWGDLLGIEPEEALGRSVRDVLPMSGDASVDQIAEMCATGIPLTFVHRTGHFPRDYEGHAFHLDGDRFAMIFVEVTDRLQAARRMEALLALGDRLREADTIPAMTRAAAQLVGETLGATRAGFGRIDLDAKTIEMERDWTRPGVASVEGGHRFADYGDLLNELVAGDPLVIDDVLDDPRSRRNPARLLDLGIRALVNMPVRERGRTVAAFFVHDAEQRRWSPEELDFLRNVADRVELGVARLRAEERQRVLNAELSHRLKNTLAMVQAIAGQTLKRVADRGAVASFEQRLGALASAHDVLLGKGWAAADLAQVAVRVLEVLDGRDRFRIEGPPVELGARASLSASLLLHELGTNAVKYGSLSVDGGIVWLTWAVTGSMLTMRWEERGGPPALLPKSRGFGSRLINLGLLGTGGVTTCYEADGLSVTMEAPLAELHQA